MERPSNVAKWVIIFATPKDDVPNDDAEDVEKNVHMRGVTREEVQAKIMELFNAGGSIPTEVVGGPA
eukprot:9561983-Heterocapsa_arctica.AAC.1